MPIYEYKCLSCGKKNEIITLRISEEISSITCKYCSSQNLKRLVSKVRIRLSEETRLERLADPSRWGNVDESDPASVAKFMRKVGKEIGEDVDGLDEAIEESLEEDSTEEAGEKDW